MFFRRLGFSLVAAASLFAALPGAAAPDDTLPIIEAKDPDSGTDAQKIVTKKEEDRPAVHHTDPLTELVEAAITETSKRRLTVGVHTPWQIVHGILALRWNMYLQQGSGQDEINAIEWIASGPTFDGMPLWEETPFGGRGHPYTRPYAFEGHPTQFMGYMTMADIPKSYKIKTATKTVTVGDIINDAKMQVREGPEITWTLWALSHYEEPDAQWINSAGEPWSIERLVQMQIKEPVTTGACGGTHGLFVLSYARNMYISTGKPLRGTWLEADQKIKRYVMEARSLQNSDGSFSSNHFQGPGYSDDFSRRITTSGHQLEWLMIALPQSKLKETWFRRGIECVARDLLKNRKTSSDCGPLFHGLHALIVYRQRTVPGYENPRPKDYLNLRMTDSRGKEAKPEAKRLSSKPDNILLAPPAPELKTRSTGSDAAPATGSEKTTPPPSAPPAPVAPPAVENAAGK